MKTTGMKLPNFKSYNGKKCHFWFLFGVFFWPTKTKKFIVERVISLGIESLQYQLSSCPIWIKVNDGVDSELTSLNVSHFVVPDMRY